jgi:hypothetical protein
MAIDVYLQIDGIKGESQEFGSPRLDRTKLGTMGRGATA